MPSQSINNGLPYPLTTLYLAAINQSNNKHLLSEERYEKGKPVARRGRKAYGPLYEAAGPPNRSSGGLGNPRGKEEEAFTSKQMTLAFPVGNFEVRPRSSAAVRGLVGDSVLGQGWGSKDMLLARRKE